MAWSIFKQGGGDNAAEDWAVALLEEVGAPVTPGNTQFVYDWEESEGGGGEYNPLNQGPVPGQPQLTTSGSQYGGGAANYASWQAGLQGASDYLSMPDYAGVLAALKANNPTGAAQALWASPWAASHYGDGADWSTQPLPGQPSAYSAGASALGTSSPATTGPGGASAVQPETVSSSLFSPLGWAAGIGGYAAQAVEGIVQQGNSIGDVATNIGSIAENFGKFFALVTYGGTWIRVGEAFLGVIIGAAGATMLIVTLAGGSGSLGAAGSVLSLLAPEEGAVVKGGRALAGDLAAGARAAGGKQGTAGRFVSGARSSSQARSRQQASTMAAWQRAAVRDRQATESKARRDAAERRAQERHAAAMERHRATMDRAGREDEGDRLFEETRGSRVENRRAHKKWLSDTTDLRRKTA